MRTRRMTKADLARRMGSSEGAIQHLLDIDRPARIGRIEQALRAVHAAVQAGV